MSSRKGTRRERELKDRLADLGCTVLRIPASGSATTDDLPDLLAGDGEGGLWAIEAKTSTPDNGVYLPPEEIDALRRFAAGLHPACVPLVCVRWDQDTTWYGRTPSQMARTDGGNYRALASHREEWLDLPAVIEATRHRV